MWWTKSCSFSRVIGCSYLAVCISSVLRNYSRLTFADDRWKITFELLKSCRCQGRTNGLTYERPQRGSQKECHTMSHIRRVEASHVASNFPPNDGEENWLPSLHAIMFYATYNTRDTRRVKRWYASVCCVTKSKIVNNITTLTYVPIVWRGIYIYKFPTQSACATRVAFWAFQSGL